MPGSSVWSVERIATDRGPQHLAPALHAEGDDERALELKQAVAIFAEVGEPGRLEPEIWKLSEW